METFIPLPPSLPPPRHSLPPPFFVCRFNRILIDRSRFDWAATELCNGCTKPRSGRIDREELRQPVVHSISPPFIFRMAAISVFNLFPVHLNKISRNTCATWTELQLNLALGLSCALEVLPHTLSSIISSYRYCCLYIHKHAQFPLICGCSIGTNPVIERGLITAGSVVLGRCAERGQDLMHFFFQTLELCNLFSDISCYNILKAS